VLLGALLAACLAGGCGRNTEVPSDLEKPSGPAWFEDITEASGLRFIQDAGPNPEKYFFPKIVGSGAAFLDFDNDGRLDVYLVHNGGPQGKKNQLFRQKPDGTFEDVSAGSGLDVAGHGMGVAVGDVNNDGLPDVLLTEYGRIRLFLNQGGGKFRDVTAEAGLDNPHWGTSAAFFDFDRDGWLDLVVVNYVNYDPTKPCGGVVGRHDFCGPHAFAGTVARLFRNLGASGRFEDVTLQSGLGRAAGAALGVVCADFTGDGWPDILVANDGAANHLWVNQRNGTFKEEAVLRGLAYDGLGVPQANMGIALGDVDGDGLPEVFITHLPEELPVLWKQGPVGYFQDWTGGARLTQARWRATGFGTVFGDFDHDGALDLGVVNGAVRHGGRPPPAGSTFWDRFTERNQLFANDGTGRFRDISPDNPAFCARPAISRSLVCGDVNNDGALDLLVTAINGPARLFRNVAPKKGHWLMVRATDPALGGRDAYGATVTVQAGKRRWVRHINPGYSYLCSNDPRAHFGLGQVERVDAIDVVWPDGTTERFGAQGVDRVISLRKGKRQAPERADR
jgi:hypothetical protein